MLLRSNSKGARGEDATEAASTRLARSWVYTSIDQRRMDI